MSHPSDADLALYAGGDLGWFAKRRIERHISACGKCQTAAVGFSASRSEMAELGDSASLPWNRLALEMKANIRLGLEAGECVSVKSVSRGLGPRSAVAFASLALLIGASFWLHRPAAELRDAVVLDAVVLESTGSGIQVREGGQVLSILNSRGKDGDVIRTVGAQGEMRARFVDSRTGLVTINNVYVQ